MIMIIMMIIMLCYLDQGHTNLTNFLKNYYNKAYARSKVNFNKNYFTGIVKNVLKRKLNVK